MPKIATRLAVGNGATHRVLPRARLTKIHIGLDLGGRATCTKCPIKTQIAPIAAEKSKSATNVRIV